MNKSRLDVLLFERGLVESRERAKAMIMRGCVFVDGNKAEKPGMQVADAVFAEVRCGHGYVSRGGRKLEKALEFFGVSPKDKVCVDCGASTGGFTDCLLQKGARMVYAVDVGYGQLAWSIRNDARVVTMERTNIRYLTNDMLSEKPELATIDVSFISLALVLSTVRELLTDDGEVVCLIKPQFEAGRGKVGKNGVVRDPITHCEVLEAFIRYAGELGFHIKGITHSPVRGPKGNVEYLGWLCRQGEDTAINVDEVVSESHKSLMGSEYD
ncbi:MAG: TlyA family RNA methyltransferase [Oscillospiraceae bacterium]|nr:TlyA family RNA methyltransferase [Oscillospiraceae bacterium]